VHHGGVGTTAQALRAGRPQLIAPYLVDQPDNAARVARLGAGRVLNLPHYTAAQVASELRQLMDEPQYATRARDVGEHIAQEDGAARAADIIVATLRETGRWRAS
jgi:rhamnosyltransferase subunit B